MHELAKKIREQRLIEATQKGYTGLDGKIGIVLKGMGEPIIVHEGGRHEEMFGIMMPTFTSTTMDDPYALQDEDEMPEFDETEPVQVGWLFDGLRRGVHMEIKYMLDTKELTLTYKGYLVYAEEAGELTCYVPHKEWEEKLEYLLTSARPMAAARHKEIAHAEREEEKQEKLGWLEKLRLYWGKF
jgi:hypothetical protein